MPRMLPTKARRFRVTPEIQQPPRGNVLWVFRLP